MIDFRRLISSFRWASAGLVHTLRTQQNARIHAMASVAVVGAGFFFHISSSEWLAIVLSIGLVLSAEVMNTSLEVLCDRVSADHDEAIGKAKDVAAGAVLIAAFVSFLVGAIVFLPKVVMLLGQ